MSTGFILEYLNNTSVVWTIPNMSIHHLFRSSELSFWRCTRIILVFGAAQTAGSSLSQCLLTRVSTVLLMKTVNFWQTLSSVVFLFSNKLPTSLSLSAPPAPPGTSFSRLSVSHPDVFLDLERRPSRDSVSLLSVCECWTASLVFVWSVLRPGLHGLARERGEVVWLRLSDLVTPD